MIWKRLRDKLKWDSTVKLKRKMKYFFKYQVVLLYVLVILNILTPCKIVIINETEISFSSVIQAF